jgi:hypothetical protein
LVLLKALAKSPEERFQTAEDFVRAIQLAIPEHDIDKKTSAPSAAATQRMTSEEENNTEGQSNPNRMTLATRRSTGMLSREAMSSRVSMPLIAGIAAMTLVGMIILVVMTRTNTNNEPPPLAATSLPTHINTSAPTNSPVPSPSFTATVEISSIPSFKDDFVGQLAEGWTWLAENPEKWSLSAVNGSLQIIASDASFDGPALPPNILVRKPPPGDFEITTSLQFSPTSDFQIAGLVIFQDQGNVLQFGRGFCDLADLCVGDGIYFDNFENGSIQGNSFHTPFHESVTYLRLRRNGSTYTSFYSKDGENWIMLGEFTREFSQVQVGVMAAQAEKPSPATFDFFTMIPLSP